MIVLDTDVMSALMKEPFDPLVFVWMEAQPRPSVWITSITVLEIKFGIALMAASRRRNALEMAYDRLLSEVLGGRILGFEGAEATEAAASMARRQLAGRPVDRNDDLIAGIVKVHRATLATRNVRHFEDAGIDLINPWEGVKRLG